MIFFLLQNDRKQHKKQPKTYKLIAVEYNRILTQEKLDRFAQIQLNKLTLCPVDLTKKNHAKKNERYAQAPTHWIVGKRSGNDARKNWR